MQRPPLFSLQGARFVLDIHCSPKPAAAQRTQIGSPTEARLDERVDINSLNASWPGEQSQLTK